MKAIYAALAVTLLATLTFAQSDARQTFDQIKTLDGTWSGKNSQGEPVKVTVEYATLPKQGETENGDAALVRRVDDSVLIAVVDALGHGALAAKAAAVATSYLAEARSNFILRRHVAGDRGGTQRRSTDRWRQRVDREPGSAHCRGI